MSDGGKGSAPRPIPNWNRFSENFDAIFGKKDASKTQDTESFKGQKAGSNGGSDSQPTTAE